MLNIDIFFNFTAVLLILLSFFLKKVEIPPFEIEVEGKCSGKGGG